VLSCSKISELMNSSAIEGGPCGIIVNSILPNAHILRPEGHPEGLSAEPEPDLGTREAMQRLRPAMGTEFVVRLAVFLVSRQCEESGGSIPPWAAALPRRSSESPRVVVTMGSAAIRGRCPEALQRNLFEG
jgi:hypothetical protein